MLSTRVYRTTNEMTSAGIASVQYLASRMGRDEDVYSHFKRLLDEWLEMEHGSMSEIFDVGSVPETELHWINPSTLGPHRVHSSATKSCGAITITQIIQ